MKTGFAFYRLKVNRCCIRRGKIISRNKSILIVVSTIFSICAIATNGAVKTGGVYFMLSRTMGPEIGGAVGVLFYFANVVCCALYVTACVEGLLNSFGSETGAFVPEDGSWGLPTGRWWNLLYSSGYNLANMALCLEGAALFGKFSLGILSLVGQLEYSMILCYTVCIILGVYLLCGSCVLLLPGPLL